jgi:cysteine desulfurase/selenocysteine lyase
VTRTGIIDARRHFPGADGCVYMDVAARGLLPGEARRALDAHLDARLAGSADKATMFETVERARSRFADLINATPDEIALTKNVSEGLNIVAAAMPWAEGDNVVLCPELEHPNNVYLWRNLARRRGVELRGVPPRDGHIAAERLIEAIDDRTRILSVSSVSFAPGFRTDLAPIGRACRDRDVLLLVDGVQSVGILATDVAASNIDALAVSTQKGLLGLYGLGFLYCRREWAERLTPAYLARFGVDFGEGAHEAALGDADYRLMPGADYRLRPGARRFDLGNYNSPGAAAADASLGLLLEFGPEAIETHVTGLARGLANGLREAGLPVFGGEPGPHLGSIVSVGHVGEGQHDGTDDPAMSTLHDELAGNGVRLSVRRGVLRLSLHLYNNDDDVARVIDIAHRWRGRNRDVASA